MTTTALIETLDGVALVTMNRPDRLNALNDELQADFLAAHCSLVNAESPPPL